MCVEIKPQSTSPRNTCSMPTFYEPPSDIITLYKSIYNSGKWNKLRVAVLNPEANMAASGKQESIADLYK